MQSGEADLATEYSEAAFREARAEAQRREQQRRTQQALPFNEGSFLDSAHVDYMHTVASDTMREWHAKVEVSRAESLRVAQAAAKVEYLCHEGWNEENWWLDIPKEAFYYWAQKEPGCWDDPQFRREFARDNPQCLRRNKTGRTVITSNWTLGRAVRAATSPCLVGKI